MPVMSSSEMENQFDLSHILGHVLSAAAIVVTFLGLLPAIAAAVAIAWYLLQFYESKSVQRWLRSRRERKIAKYTKLIQELEARKKIYEKD